MPKLNFERGNPGTFISGDRRYLYAFMGFNNIQSENSPVESQALSSIERLDLRNEHLGWEVLDLKSDENSDISKELTAKGCFVMFNMEEFDSSKIHSSFNRESNLYNKRSNPQL